MQTIIEELEKTFGAESLAGSKSGAPTDVVYLRVNQNAVLDIMSSFDGQGIVLIALFAVENFEGKGLSLLYIFERRGASQLLTLVVSLKEGHAASVAGHFPNACYFEREVADGFGVEFDGAFDTRRLFLHENYPEGFHPLLKSFVNKPLDWDLSNPQNKEYIFRPCSGEGIYEVPVGPVHAGIIEPGHFRFSVIGETIFNLELRHFYKHRGLEKLAEGKTPLECTGIAEAVSGDESAANATALAMAVENICGAAVPLRAWQLRTILLELERAYSHLGDLAGMALDVAYPLGAAAFFNLREEVLRQNAALTGSRFSKGIVIPGGLKNDMASSSLAGLLTYTNDFVGRLEEAVSDINASGWVIDRFETTGVIRKDLVMPLNLSGPTARASGVGVDTRMDHPYGIYGKLRVEEHIRDSGDVLARFYVKADEIKNSIRLVQDVLGQLMAGPVSVEVKPGDGYGLALVEAARGQNLHWVYLKDGRIQRYKVRTASFCNWPAIEHAVMGNIVADFPVINKSLNLSYAGNDL
jgi:Ni,Fe-hydrogenase III large subunit/Ni,Fe-hydrogenase III component G